MNEPPACSTGARQRQDPLAGTAPPVWRWLLIEHDGPWATTLLGTEPLAGALAEEIDVACARHHARPMLVRRPGRRAGAERRHWWVVDVATRTQLRGRWRTADDLYAAVEALEAIRHPGAGAERAEDMLLVCAHAKHDACCAVRGRPVAAELAKAWPVSTWECSHLGGDRFAGNLLVLPDSVVYGGLGADIAVEAVRGHMAGSVRADVMRGVTTLNPAAQVAVVAALEAFGPAPFDAWSEEATSELGDNRWQVDLRPAGGRGEGERPQPHLRAVVQRSFGATVQLTCRSALPRRVPRYEVLELSAGQTD